MMKRAFPVILSLVLAISQASIPAMALEPEEAAPASAPQALTTDSAESQGASPMATATVINVTDPEYGAVPNDGIDDTYAIQKALTVGKSKDGYEKTTVVIPKGTYNISSTVQWYTIQGEWKNRAIPLFVFSNTTIQAKGATLEFTVPTGTGIWPMLSGAHFSETGSLHPDIGNPNNDTGCTHGGYDQLYNVVIDGGTWNCGANKKETARSSSAFNLRHSRNIQIKNATVQYYSMHAVNLSGSKNTLVANTTFKNAYPPPDRTRNLGSLSVIHLDIMHKDGEVDTVLDNTPVSNAVVRNCVFDKVYAGVGTDHDNASKRSSGITIEGCTFKNFKNTGNGLGYAIQLPSMNNILITNNSFSGVGIAVLLYKKDRQSTGCQNAMVLNNTISNTSEQGIYARLNSKNITVSANVVNNCATHGIAFQNTSGTITGNVVKGHKEYGIVANGSDNAYTLKIVDNCVSGTRSGYKDILVGPKCSNGKVTYNAITSRGVRNDSGSKVSVAYNAKRDAPTGKLRRVFGSSAYDTMEQIVKIGWMSDSKGGTVIVTTGNNFPDALSAAGVAGLENAPILLTDGKKLSSQTKTELQRLAPSKVIIAGGRGAVRPAVEAEIASVTKVTPQRLKGATASETANALNLEYAGKWSATAIVATSKNYADALSAAPISYAQHMPIFLADSKSSISDATIEAMKSCGIRNVVVVGGKGAVGPEVHAKLAASDLKVTKTLKGSTRYDTSKAVAEWGKSLGMKADKMGIACGTNYYDALTGAALCGKNNAVLVLADQTNAARGRSFLSSNKTSIKVAYMFGGPAPINPWAYSNLDGALK